MPPFSEPARPEGKHPPASASSQLVAQRLGDAAGCLRQLGLDLGFNALGGHPAHRPGDADAGDDAAGVVPDGAGHTAGTDLALLVVVGEALPGRPLQLRQKRRLGGDGVLGKARQPPLPDQLVDLLLRIGQQTDLAVPPAGLRPGWTGR